METNGANMGPKYRQECHRKIFQQPENGERHFPAAGRKTKGLNEDQNGAKMLQNDPRMVQYNLRIIRNESKHPNT
jgi:hypothetical protein